MTAPLPLNYAKGRSLVDKTRIRWAGAGDILLGLLFLAGTGISAMLFGLLLIGLGVATWVLTLFGTRHFTQLAPASKTVVVIGALGYLLIAFIHLLWIAINKLVNGLTKTKPTP
jgi:hypothetical protein